MDAFPLASRRGLLAFGAGLLVVPDALAEAAPRPLIGYVSWFTAAGNGAHLSALREGLREFGLVEGRTIDLEAYFTDGNAERTRLVLRDLVARRARVIVASATPVAHLAKETTVTVPIVMGSVADALASGLVPSLARPGGNMTGISTISTEQAGKRVELAHEMRPSLRIVAFLGSSRDVNTAIFVAGTEAAAARLGIRVVVRLVDGPGAIVPAVFADLRTQGAEVVFVQPIFTGYHESIVALANESGLPVVGAEPRFAEAGAILSFSPDVLALARRAAFFVDRILKGADPATMPIEQPTNFVLIINARAAKRFGWRIPEALEIRADRMIE